MYLLERCAQIKITYYNLQGEKLEKILDENQSRIFLHEYDHLEGYNFNTNYIEKVSIPLLGSDKTFEYNWTQEQISKGYIL